VQSSESRSASAFPSGLRTTGSPAPTSNQYKPSLYRRRSVSAVGIPLSLSK